MQLEKGIRLRQLKPYPLGHREPVSFGRWDQPVMDTSKRRGRKSLEMQEMLTWPAEICLRAIWQPVKLDRNQVSAQSVLPDLSHEVCKFYAIQAAEQPELARYSANKSVELTYQGTGKYKRANKSEVIRGHEFDNFVLKFNSENEVIYTKQFLWQQSGTLTLRRHPLGYGDWFVTPPKRTDLADINLVGLLGYGGYAKSGTPINEIEQVYARIGHVESRTSVELHSQSNLLRKKIQPPNGGVIGEWIFRYMDLLKTEDLLSLAGVLEAGYVQISLVDNEDSKLYCSTSYQQFDAATNMVDIIFTPKT